MYFDQIALGKRMKALRVEKGLSQEGMAERLCISTRHYGNIERGTVGCSVDLLLEMSGIFRVSTDFLLLGRDPSREEEVRKLQDIAARLNDVIRSL